MIKYHSIVTSEELKEKLAELNNVVILKFTLSGCIECKGLDAEMDKLEPKYDVDIIVINVSELSNDDFDMFKEKYELNGAPICIMVDTEGKEIDRLKGFKNQKQVLAFCDLVHKKN